MTANNSLFDDEDSIELTGFLLKSPLSVIIGTLDMMKEGFFDELPSNEKRQLVNNAYMKAQKMSVLISDGLEKLKTQRIKYDSAPPSSDYLTSDKQDRTLSL